LFEEDLKLKETIRKIALLNAVKHNGKAQNESLRNTGLKLL